MGFDEDLTSLPRELLETVLSKLDAVSQQRIRSVCSVWNKIITAPHGECRRHVHFELGSEGRLASREKIGLPYDESPQTAFALCVGRETRSVVFSQSLSVAGLWPQSRYPYLTIALRMRLHEIQINGHAMVLPRLIFVNLTLPPAALYRGILCCPEMVREVWLRHVTLVAPLKLSTGPFCMEIPGVYQRFDTTDDAQFFGGTEDHFWARYVAECGGPLRTAEEQVVLESLRTKTLAEKLSEELDGDAADTLHHDFWGEFAGMEAKDFTVEWLRSFDVWTVRFLFHYFVSVCNVQPVHADKQVFQDV